MPGTSRTTAPGRIVLITGAATGLGFAIARAFGAAGDRVFVTDLTQERVDETVHSLRQREIDASGCVADVRDPAQVENQFDLVEVRFGTPEIVVANAGIYPNTPFLDLSVEEWDAVLEIDLRGAFLTCQSAARRMVSAGVRGHLIVMSSGAASTAFHGWSHYSAAKAGLVMLAKSMALELGAYGIRANAVLPGYVDVEEGGRHLSEEYRATSQTANPLGEPVQAADIADVVVMLASGWASAVNGAAISVDRGSSVGRHGIYPRGR
jgi:3-oxoacyl-[acyl-carrier protein] reductase